MLRAPICNLLGMKVPIVQAAIWPAAAPELVAAVCEAGGLGSIGAVFESAESIQKLDSGTREMVAVAMDEHHARLLNLLNLARLKVLGRHLRHFLGALPARWCDGPGLRKRGSRRPCSGSGKVPSPVAFAYSPAWSPDPAPAWLSSVEEHYPGR